MISGSVALVELIGSFLFFSVILQHGAAIPIAVALAAAIFFGGAISGGHFNPAVTLMMYLKGTLATEHALQYILMHALAAVAAVYVATKIFPSSSLKAQE